MKSRICLENLNKLPILTFQHGFAGGGDLVLDILCTFQIAGSTAFYSAIRSSSPDDINLIGVRTQQGYNTAHDLAGKKICFQRIDC